VPGGGKRIVNGANAPDDAGFAKEVLEWSYGWKGKERKPETEGPPLGLEDLGIVLKL
jgi:hypothetical protein